MKQGNQISRVVKIHKGGKGGGGRDRFWEMPQITAAQNIGVDLLNGGRRKGIQLQNHIPSRAAASLGIWCIMKPVGTTLCSQVYMFPLYSTAVLNNTTHPFF